MAGSNETDDSRLHQIASILGIPVAAFSAERAAINVADLQELLHLWQRLRTPTSRDAVLDTLRQILEREDW